MGRMDGKVAIVTGAARGTGEAVVRLFAREGARVLATDVLDDRGAEVARGAGPEVAYQHLDVRREGDWQSAVARVGADFGKLDVLVNNAAVLVIRDLASTKREELTELIEVNQVGPYLGMQAVLAPMKAAGGGSIVNVASTDGFKGQNLVSAYASTKWALRGITKCAAIELARHRIRVNAVCPDYGSLEMFAPMLPPGVDPEAAADEAANRLLDNPPGYGWRDRVDDVARAVLFLASDDCRMCTGADLVVDGGLSAGHHETITESDAV